MAVFLSCTAVTWPSGCYMGLKMSSQPSDTQKGAGPQDEPEEDFQATLKRLEALVERLEGGELGLEESLASFEQGVGLTRQARSRLDAAELKVKTLLERDDGQPEERDNGGQQ